MIATRVKPIARLVRGAVPLAAAALLLASCGGSSSGTSSSGNDSTSSNSPSATGAAAASGAGAASSAGSSPSAHTDRGSGANTSSAVTPLDYARAHHSIVPGGAAVIHHPRHGTGGAEVNDDNPGHADTGGGKYAGRNPCGLVTAAQAQAIFGKPAHTTSAPLGPTCIYRPVGGGSLVTITVQAVGLRTVSSHMHGRTQLNIGGHTAYCGTYGQTTTFVSLTGGRVLTVTGPCMIGARFAAAALPRVKGG